MFYILDFFSSKVKVQYSYYVQECDATAAQWHFKSLFNKKNPNCHWQSGFKLI